mmetsp:Transcript_37483/g.86454  ORF Transcript_37483/g.86454 Transcript_37483/m.86454 type:complete len:217 (-) Transcript_37483:271-921(-)
MRCLESVTCCRDNQGGTSGLCERAKEVRSHACNITNIVTHVVCNAPGVTVIILVHAVVVLSRQVCAYISSLCVDTSAHTTKQCNRGATEPVACNGLEHVLWFCKGEALLEDDDEGPEGDDTDGDQRQAHHTASLDGDVVPILDVQPALMRSPHIGENSNAHADVAGTDGSHATDDESDGSCNTCEDDQEDGEGGNVDRHVYVFLVEKGHGTFADDA